MLSYIRVEIGRIGNVQAISSFYEEMNTILKHEFSTTLNIVYDKSVHFTTHITNKVKNM